MKQATIGYCLTDSQVLLGMKKISFGAGKWNGFGGKIQAGESPEQAMVRELKEESGLTTEVTDLEKGAHIRFYFDTTPAFECHVFLIRKWKNEPVETEEMRPEWFPLSTIPYDSMWAADTKWLPLILAGEKIKATVMFNAEGTAVKDFSYVPAVFAAIAE